MSTAIAPHLIHMLTRLNGSALPELDASVSSLCEALEQGHVCLPSDKVSGLHQLRACSVVGNPGDFRPLILDASGRLYLQRYWEHENRLALNPSGCFVLAVVLRKGSSPNLISLHCPGGM